MPKKVIRWAEGWWEMGEVIEGDENALVIRTSGFVSKFTRKDDGTWVTVSGNVARLYEPIANPTWIERGTHHCDECEGEGVTYERNLRSRYHARCPDDLYDEVDCEECEGTGVRKCEQCDDQRSVLYDPDFGALCALCHELALNEED